MYLFTTLDDVGEITAKDIKKAKFSKLDKILEKLEYQEDKDFLNSVIEEIYDVLNLQYMLETRDKEDNEFNSKP